MRTCKFYSPGQQHLIKFPHLELSEEYEFDKPMMQSNCACPAVVGEAPYAACGFEAEYTACMFYEKEEWRTVKSVEVTRTDAELALMRAERIGVQQVRTSIGVPSYRITLERLYDEDGAYGEPEILHIINGGTHGEKSRDVAQALFEQEINTVRSEYPKEDVPLLQPEIVSYIETVTK